MKITQEQLSAYVRMLDKIEDAAAEVVEKEVKRRKYGTPEQRLSAREELMDVFVAVEDQLGAASGDVAMDFVRGVYSSNDFNATPILTDNAPRRSMRNTVAYWFDKSMAGQAVDVDALSEHLGEAIRSYVRRSANSTIVDNVASFGVDSQGLRYMRVPVGAHTCAFCLMLCSRGPVYTTQVSAGDMAHFHEGCDCIVVPGFGEFAVDGYSWKAYRAWWDANVVNDIYGREDFKATFNSFRRSVYWEELRDYRNELRRIDYARQKIATMTEPEFASVTSEINTWYHYRFEGLPAAAIQVGDTEYHFRISEFGEYEFMYKREIL